MDSRTVRASSHERPERGRRQGSAEGSQDERRAHYPIHEGDAGQVEGDAAGGHQRRSETVAHRSGGRESDLRLCRGSAGELGAHAEGGYPRVDGEVAVAPVERGTWSKYSYQRQAAPTNPETAVRTADGCQFVSAVPTATASTDSR